MFALLSTFSWQELRHHPWRSLAAFLAVSAGVALAFSVQLINASALGEFSRATREVDGKPDLVLRAVQPTFDDRVLDLLATQPQVALASPVLEVDTYAVAAPGGERLALRVIGLDVFSAATVTPALMPRPFDGASRLTLFEPGAVFLNQAAWARLGLKPATSDGSRATATTLLLQSGLALHQVAVRGMLAAGSDEIQGGRAMAVMDIAAAQELFGQLGQISRIDLRLAPGADPSRVARELALPPGLRALDPALGESRAGQLSRAYRVNLTVLALVALFTGAFLVYSVQSLSVIQRAPQFALLAVLGLTARQRLRLVLVEALALGVLASGLGVAAGGALAALALRLLGADLGGGYFRELAPPLQWDTGVALLYFVAGVLAALVGAWWPARQAQRLPPATTLKGLALGTGQAGSVWSGAAMLLAGAGCTGLPPVAGLPLGAYLGVALLLIGGVLVLPALIGLLLRPLASGLARRPLWLLAVERARRMRQGVAMSVGAVLVSLSLAVAMTVMVASFRDSVAAWLDVVLPADLYLRVAGTSTAAETAYLSEAALLAVAGTPGVARTVPTRSRVLQLRADLPAVVLLARPLTDPARELPLVGTPSPPAPGQAGVYVSEAMLELHGMRVGERATVLEQALRPGPADATLPALVVAGVWRDYARQFGSIAMDLTAYRLASGDPRVNDLAIWLDAGAGHTAVTHQIRERVSALTPGAGSTALIEISSAQQLRAVSLRIFDRTFAVTYWLQAVAVAIGLFGIATSFSAQVLARRREFGLLAHVGLTRRQILGLVAAEGASWTLIGVLAGWVLGLAIATILVEVVNPQSFHWTMTLAVPWDRLALLGLAVLAAGTTTAWLAGRAAASRDVIRAVREDW